MEAPAKEVEEESRHCVTCSKMFIALVTSRRMYCDQHLVERISHTGDEKANVGGKPAHRRNRKPRS